MITAALVCFVAWHHYLHMADEWDAHGKAPTVYRYMDWFITVPMQVLCFYLILSAANPADKPPIHVSLGVRLFVISVMMLIFGYMGEVDIMNPMVAFVLAFAMYGYILYEVYAGEASKINRRLSLNEAKRFLANVALRNEATLRRHQTSAGGDGSSGGHIDDDTSDEDDVRILDPQKRAERNMRRQMEKLGVNAGAGGGSATARQKHKELAMAEFEKPDAQVAFEILRFIVLFGWLLYPVGYLVGYVTAEKVDDHWVLNEREEKALNLIYNVADLINKCAFGFGIFFAASSASEKDKEGRAAAAKLNAQNSAQSQNRFPMMTPFFPGFGQFGGAPGQSGGKGAEVDGLMKSNTQGYNNLHGLMQPSLFPGANPNTLLQSPESKGSAARGGVVANDPNKSATGEDLSPNASKFSITGMMGVVPTTSPAGPGTSALGTSMPFFPGAMMYGPPPGGMMYHGGGQPMFTAPAAPSGGGHQTQMQMVHPGYYMAAGPPPPPAAGGVGNYHQQFGGSSGTTIQNPTYGRGNTAGSKGSAEGGGNGMSRAGGGGAETPSDFDDESPRGGAAFAGVDKKKEKRTKSAESGGGQMIVIG
eukprot:g4119.t1